MDELIHVLMEDVYLQIRWPLYQIGQTGVRAMHPMLFLYLESAGVLTTAIPAMPAPASAPTAPAQAGAMPRTAYHMALAAHAQLSQGGGPPPGQMWTMHYPSGNGSGGGPIDIKADQVRTGSDKCLSVSMRSDRCGCTIHSWLVRGAQAAYALPQGSAGSGGYPGALS